MSDHADWANTTPWIVDCLVLSRGRMGMIEIMGMVAMNLLNVLFFATLFMMSNHSDCKRDMGRSFSRTNTNIHIFYAQTDSTSRCCNPQAHDRRPGPTPTDPKHLRAAYQIPPAQRHMRATMRRQQTAHHAHAPKGSKRDRLVRRRGHELSVEWAAAGRCPAECWCWHRRPERKQHPRQQWQLHRRFTQCHVITRRIRKLPNLLPRRHLLWRQHPAQPLSAPLRGSHPRP